MSKLLGISLVLGAAVLATSATVFAGHRSGCHTPGYYWPSQGYYQPAPGYYQPAPQMGQAPGTQTYRGFSYEPGTEAPAVTPQGNVPTVMPGYQGSYRAPQRFGGSSRPSYLDAGRKIRGNFGR